MAWFISPGQPAYAVVINEERSIRFVNAEYRTVDPEEISILRANPHCIEADAAVSKPLVSPKPWAVDQKNMIIHHMNRAGMLCKLPPELYSEEFEPGKAWRYGNYWLFRRLSDARRWNKGASMCQYCGGE